MTRKPQHQDSDDQLRRVADLIARSSLGTGALSARRGQIPQESINIILERAATLDDPPADRPDESDEGGVWVLHRRFRGGRIEPGDSFAERLNTLFGYIYPPGGGPHHDGEVAVALTASGFPISRPYITELRSGRRTDPSKETTAALAKFFMVKPDYFWDRRYAASVNRDLALLARMRGSASLR